MGHRGMPPNFFEVKKIFKFNHLAAKASYYGSLAVHVHVSPT